MTVIDATVIDTPENADEVLALHVSYAIEGDVVTIHADTCPTARDTGWRCKCRPITMTIGAKA